MLTRRLLKYAMDNSVTGMYCIAGIGQVQYCAERDFLYYQEPDGEGFEGAYVVFPYEAASRYTVRVPGGALAEEPESYPLGSIVRYMAETNQLNGWTVGVTGGATNVTGFAADETNLILTYTSGVTPTAMSLPLADPLQGNIFFTNTVAPTLP